MLAVAADNLDSGRKIVDCMAVDWIRMEYSDPDSRLMTAVDRSREVPDWKKVVAEGSPVAMKSDMAARLQAEELPHQQPI